MGKCQYGMICVVAYLLMWLQQEKSTLNLVVFVTRLTLAESYSLVRFIYHSFHS